MDIINPTSLRVVNQSQTLLINEQSAILEGSGQNVIRFGFGQSPFNPPQSAIKEFQENCMSKDYAPVTGYKYLRDSIAKYHGTFENLDIDPEQVLVGPGSKMMIYSVLLAFNKADVLLPNASWVSYEPQAKLCGHNILTIQTSYESQWKINLDSLDKVCSERKKHGNPLILILNSPGNPSGMAYSAEELEALSVILRKHEVLVISDEIYGNLHHKNQHVSMMHYYPERTIISSGISKWAGAGGWRMGYLVLPKTMLGKFKETLVGIASETFSSVTSPVQKAANHLYEHFSDFAGYLAHQQKILHFMGQYIANELRSAGVAVHDPQGGFYLLPDFTEILKNSSIKTSDQFCQNLLEKQCVALLPGTAFNLPPETIATRLAFVCFNGDTILNASFSIPVEKPFEVNFLKQNAPLIVTGIERIKSFLQDI